MTAFVVTNGDTAGLCKTILGFRSVLPTASASVTTEDPDYPISLAVDNSYHTEFSPLSSTTCEIIFILPSIEDVNYFTIVSKNAVETELAGEVFIYRASTAAYVSVGEFNTMTNGKPVMIYFGPDFESGYADALRVKVVLTYSDKPYIMAMMAGKAIVFGNTMSVGFQPPFGAYLDEVEQFSPDDGFNVTIGRRIAKGKQLKGHLGYVRMTTLKEFWDEYSNHVLDSKPLCIMWNITIPDEIIYGLQVPDKLTKPSYKNSAFAQVDFEVVGFA